LNKAPVWRKYSLEHIVTTLLISTKEFSIIFSHSMDFRFPNSKWKF